MQKLMVVGAGKIGSLIACMLADSGDYQIHLADIAFTGSDVARLLRIMPAIVQVVLDVQDEEKINAYLQVNAIAAVVSCLPYYLNIHVARAAKAAKAHYFDLTEDTAVTKEVKILARGAQTAFVPQCGLAPGFINIAANSLMQEFQHCYHAKLRVGALPQRSINALHYALTWSTDGIINEYGNPCYGIEKGKQIVYQPLEGLEQIQIEGTVYEAFNTSGGLGSLAELYDGKIQTLNYKTIRCPGHCEKIRFLMNDLNLNNDRKALKHILEKVIPKTYQDVVIVFVSIEGLQQEELVEKSYFKKIYPAMIHNIEWSAIQLGTAAGVCSVVDWILTNAKDYQGLILQEKFNLADILANRFGCLYA